MELNREQVCCCPTGYDAALSTMYWNQESEPVEMFFNRGGWLGFSCFELNHQIPPAVLDSVDLSGWPIRALHDPCPAVVPAKQLEREDRVVTSLDESRRRVGVDTVKYTIETACRLGAGLVVIHPGRIAGDHSPDDRLRALYRQGRKGTPEYEDLRRAVTADRNARRQPHLDALLNSMAEIVAFARDTGLRLGLENRFHYYELPDFDEMAVLLAAFPQPWVGWQFDIGHLQVHDALGLMSFPGWLARFGERIVGVHLHDVQGIVDHCAPGSGDVDFDLVAAHLPADAQRTLEVRNTLSPTDVCTGMERLAFAGCVARR